ELLRGSDMRCIELMRMFGEAYVHLCTHFRHKLWLLDSRHVSVEEKMTMFLTIIGHNEHYVVIKRMFQHFSQTIHKDFHEVLATMMSFAREMIVSSTFDPNPDSPGVTSVSQWSVSVEPTWHHVCLLVCFSGIHDICITALINFCGRGKGKCYQNVLGICDFNMIFTFVYAGWEGVSHDSRVLIEVIAELSNNFPFPPSKYYLCDATYINTQEFMAPYCNVRYWLGDFRHKRAMTKEEKFNHAYSKLRNVIERAYGVLKARFSILDKMTPYPFNVYMNVVIACFVVNNFIRKENINNELFA
ncbi:DDE_4 domain-containing protein, partial [Cephalotus follicularis]